MESRITDRHTQLIDSNLRQQATPCIRLIQNQLINNDSAKEIAKTHQIISATICIAIVQHNVKCSTYPHNDVQHGAKLSNVLDTLMHIHRNKACNASINLKT